MSLFGTKMLFLWKKNELYGFIDRNRKEIIPCIHESVSKMINNCVWLFKKGFWVFSDDENNIIIDKKINELIDYDGNLSIVRIKKDYFIIDHELSNKFTKLKEKINPISICENNFILSKKNNKFGYLNNNGNILIDFLFDQANQFVSEYASVKIKNKWGVINIKGNFVVAPKYDYISYDCTGYIKVILDNKKYFIDKNENIYLENLFNKYYFHNFSELLVGFEYKNKKGFMNQFFEIEILKKFDEISEFKNDYCIIKYKGKYGVINKKFKWVLKPIYKKIIEFDGFSFFVINNKDEYDHIGVNGNSILN
ncbi:WG repeat-containing protein [Malacoplasma muris]|uniref:WG repeat-containing protein n=1 Tax=Malacoplasma muris TaxID=2119 RepID=UPI00398F14D2